MRSSWFILLVFVALLSGAASAAFVDGVESFSGTALDTSTWRSLTVANNQASITQNNGLHFNFPSSPAGDAEVVTMSQTVGVGQSVQADFRPNTGNSTGYFYLALTTNLFPDPNINRFVLYASRGVDIAAEHGALPGFTGEQSSTDTSGTRSTSGYRFVQNLQFGTTYRDRIDWVSPTQFDFSVFTLDAAGNPTQIGQVTESIPNEPSPLYVALHSTDMDVTVDNVAVAAVPEPAVAAVGTLMGCLLMRRRRPRGLETSDTQ
ncbi:MAG TPA: hypothetical protein VN541_10755 [Tepidisphaeraceae bacterium]|nr:hypothetical protein [Tepidisphaeraceae bacterium]